MVTDENEFSPDESPHRSHRLWRGIGVVLVVGLVLVGSFELVYAGKIMPGVSANGVYIGGLDRDAAMARLADKTQVFRGGALTLNYGGTALHIPVNSLGVTYDNSSAGARSFAVGRNGGWLEQLADHTRALAGQSTTIDTSSYDDSKLTSYVQPLIDDALTPVGDAALSFNDRKAQVTPSVSGTRVDIGRLIQSVSDRIAATDADPISVNEYQLQPLISTEALQQSTAQADTFVASPIALTSTEINQTIDQNTIISWLKINHRSPRQFLTTLSLDDLYPGAVVAGLSLDPAAVSKYVATLTAQSNHAPLNAVLGMQDGKLTVIAPSRNGVKLDEASALADITAAAMNAGASRTVALKMDVTKADVREDNLDQLGIKEQISEGQTFFPGSTGARLINVRTGTAKMNGVLIKPGQVFSFDTVLGDIGPETGYVPELVILGDHEEKQYGGGLCQVSSTAYRAALLAGLPINQRQNHSFAISYYTNPYGVPGVDATIYPPDVDLKFTNDTGSYILIQTRMEGTVLTFDFFGTKTKTGVIRGPQFITGSNDVTKPSHTVFYRDVVDLTGKVTKTDTVNTYYQSSVNFPLKQEFH